MANVKGNDNYDIMPQIEGNDIVPPGGSTSQVLTKDSSSNWDYSWQQAVALGELSSVQARRSTNFTIPTTFSTVITLNNTDIENDATTVSHDPVTNSSRITIGVSGLYLVGFSLSGIVYAADASTETAVQVRVIKNGVATAVDASEADDGNYYSLTGAISENTHISHTFLVDLTAGDYIELQAASQALRAVTGYTASVEAETVFFAVKQEGVKGDVGATGSGTNINAQDDSIAVPNSPFSTLNFGAGITATDGGGGILDITTGTPADLAAVSHRRTTQLSFTQTYVSIPFDTQEIENDSSVIERTSSTVITVLETGEYLLLINLLLQTSNVDKILTIRLSVNGSPSTIIDPIAISIGDTSDVAAVTPARVIELTANDTLEIEVVVDANTGYVNAGSNFSVVRQAAPRGPAGADGADGADGAPGSGSTLIAKDEGVNVANTPHSAYNFIGPAVSVVDGGSGVADITVSSNTFVQRDSVSIGKGSTTAELGMNSTPIITSGTEIATLDFTPTSASNAIQLNYRFLGDVSADRGWQIFVFRDSTLISIDAMGGWKRGYYGSISGTFFDTPATTSTITYSIRVAVSPSGTIYWGQNVGGDDYNGGLVGQTFSIAEVTVGV